MSGAILLFLVQDVAGVAVVGVAARVLKAILCWSQLDTIMDHGCPCSPCWWVVLRGLAALLCRPLRSCRGYRAHARCRTLGLLYCSILEECLCLFTQVATLGRRWLGHSTK